METQSQKVERKFKVFRRPITAEEYSDPCAGIEFDPPKDSDALFDALRFAFPGGLSHRGRMRDAVIEFLVQERDDECSSDSGRSKTGPSPLPDTPKNIVLDTNSPCEGVGGRATGQWKDMASVWSSTSGLARQPRWRRAMNEQEKREYRKRRVTGACEMCKKRKRKCTHDGVDGYEGDSDSPLCSSGVPENMMRQESRSGKRKAVEMRESTEVPFESGVGVDNGDPNLTQQEGYQSDGLDSEWMSSIATPVPPINFSAHEFSMEYPQSAPSAVGAYGTTPLHEAIPLWWNSLDTLTYQNTPTNTFYLSTTNPITPSDIAEDSCWSFEDETYQSGEEREKGYLKPFRRR